MRGSILLLILCTLCFLAGVGVHACHRPPDAPPPGITYDSTRTRPDPPKAPVQAKAIVLYRTIRDTIRECVPVPRQEPDVYAVSSSPPVVEQHGRTVTLSPLWVVDSLRFISYSFPVKRPAFSWGLYATARHDVMGYGAGLRLEGRYKRLSVFAGASAYPDRIAPLWGLQVRLAGSP